MESKGRATDHQPKPWSVLPLLLPALWVRLLLQACSELDCCVWDWPQDSFSVPWGVYFITKVIRPPDKRTRTANGCIGTRGAGGRMAPMALLPALGCCTGLRRRRSRSRMRRLPCVRFTRANPDGCGRTDCAESYITGLRRKLGIKPHIIRERARKHTHQRRAAIAARARHSAGLRGRV
jgi:hypothetical protein